MEEDMRHEDMSHQEANQSPKSKPGGLVALVIVLACATAISLGWVLYQRQNVGQLSADNAQMKAENAQMSSTVGQLRNQLDGLSSKLNSLSTAEERPAAAPTRRATRRVASTRRRADDPRWKKMQSQIDEEQKEIAGTRDDLQKARTDLQNSLQSTHDELNGSIAKNHDELVALEKKGERSYYEFDLSKSKRFQRVGPVSISLRKTNTKHERYNAEVLVGDNQIGKKDAALYEPVLFYPEGAHRPIELVVNHISKDGVHGYVSSPKYTESELASASGGANAANPPAANTPNTGQTGSEDANKSTDQSLPHRPQI